MHILLGEGTNGCQTESLPHGESPATEAARLPAGNGASRAEEQEEPVVKSPVGGQDPAVSPAGLAAGTPLSSAQAGKLARGADGGAAQGRWREGPCRREPVGVDLLLGSVALRMVTPNLTAPCGCGG